MSDEIKPYYFDLFQHMSDNHGLTLLDSEMDEIVRVANQYSKCGSTHSESTVPVPMELVRDIIMHLKRYQTPGRQNVFHDQVPLRIAKLEALLK